MWHNDSKVGLIQFCLSAPKTDMENNVVVSDYAAMDRILREERKYILGLCKKVCAEAEEKTFLPNKREQASNVWRMSRAGEAWRRHPLSTASKYQVERNEGYLHASRGGCACARACVWLGSMARRSCFTACLRVSFKSG